MNENGMRPPDQYRKERVIPDVTPGKLRIVGIGPGDPKHLTLWAVETILKADLILTRPENAMVVKPYLEGKTVVGPERWNLLWKVNGKPWLRALPGMEGGERRSLIARKNRERDAYADELKALLASGKEIVILDGGDPTVFATFFFWILEAFSPDQVEIIPGVGAITASFAALKRCSTGAGAHFVIQTEPESFFGQPHPGDSPYGPVDDVTRYPGTLVFYMAADGIASLAERLRQHLAGNTPAAVVYHAGVTDKEIICRGTLDTIAGLTRDEEEKWVGLVIVGRCLEMALPPPDSYHRI